MGKPARARRSVLRSTVKNGCGATAASPVSPKQLRRRIAAERVSRPHPRDGWRTIECRPSQSDCSLRLVYQPSRNWAAANATPPHAAEISIRGENLFTESLTSTADDPGNTVADPFAAPDGNTDLGVFGVFADERSNTLWDCFSSPRGSRDPNPPTSTLKVFDLQTAALKGSYPLPTWFVYGLRTGGCTSARSWQIELRFTAWRVSTFRIAERPCQSMGQPWQDPADS
jgi:hypothetical protein